jgi:DNA polymerase-3 subunit alpha
MSFVHLHRHSEYSRLDGVGTAKQYAQRASELGQPALAQTDHGTLSGALHHIVACTGRDDKGKKLYDAIVPISGVEAYFRPDRLKAKEEKERKAWHLCLFAKNMKGWHSLLQIVSAAYGEPEEGGGFYDKPCVDWELLERHNEGLVCSTACVSSWLAHLINLGHDPEVRSYIQRMRRIFKDDFWIEIMPHDFDDQRVLNKELLSIADDYSIPVIATNDAHFPYKDWADTHRIVKMLNSGSSFEKAERDVKAGKADYLAELNPTLYLADAEEMFLWFDKYHPDLPQASVDEAMANTLLFAQSITPFMLDKNIKLPKVTESVDTSKKIMRDWIEHGMARVKMQWRDDGLSADEMEEREVAYWERVETEWEILVDKGVLDYFVMVGEIVRWCDSTEPLPGDKGNKEPIRVGLGRGSAAGCLISYLVGIVKIDPIAYDLLFERFLNPNRKGLPDIDLDFQSDRRAEVKEFIARRYGKENVADIITHTTFQPKKVLGDLMRVFDYSPPEQKAVTKKIEIRQDAEETTLDEILPLYEHLQKLKEANPELWKHAQRLEGTVANAGKHAAGVIITPKPIASYMALERGKSGDLVTSWSDAADFAVISDYGFVKLDALGIKGLQIHDYACKLIEERTGEKIDLYALPALRNPYAIDERVMDGFRQGLTMGVFQFGGRGITKLLKAVKPDTVLDIAAVNALYRPGPMKSGMTWDFPKRKNNVFMRSYINDDLKEWLEETYGIIAYQEQVMRVAGGIGRMSAGDTDDLRKAMGKLYRIKGGTAAKDFMRQYEVPFFDGAIEDHNWTHAEAEEVWNMFLEFGHYGFNKSHSCSYALQAYQDMYLKMLYPHEFYAAILTFEEDEDKIKAAVREARSLGIELEGPLLNKSGAGYTTDGEVLRLGLMAIKGMGAKSAKQALKERPFEDMEDFLTRGKNLPLRALIESGACDDFLDRSYALSLVQRPKRDGSEEYWQIWEHIKHNTTLKKPRDVPKFRKEPSRDELDTIRDLSFTVPLRQSVVTEEAAEYIRENAHLGDEFIDAKEGEHIICGGEVTRVAFKKTKKGADYATFTVVFETDEWSCKTWQAEFNAFRDLLIDGMEVMVSGRKDVWNDYESVVVEEMVSMQEFFMPDEDETDEESVDTSVTSQSG